MELRIKLDSQVIKVKDMYISIYYFGDWDVFFGEIYLNSALS